MKRTRTRVAATVALAALWILPTPADAVGNSCDNTERWSLRGKDGDRFGSFDVTSVSGSLPNITVRPGRATGFVAIYCSWDTAEDVVGGVNEDASASITLGGYVFYVNTVGLADRSGSQYVFRGLIDVTRKGFPHEVITTLPGQVTVRDRDDLAYASGARPNDSIKLEVFAEGTLFTQGSLPMKPPTAEPIMIFKGPVWGNKILGDVFSI